VDPRHLRDLPHQAGIEPAAAALAAGDRAEFIPALPDQLTDLVVQLRRKWAGPNARRVGLADAKHIADRPRSYAGASRRLRGHGVRGRHERISAMVDVEQRALRSFEQNAVSRLPPF